MRSLNKDFWREIKNTRSRFLSILILVSLAVAFLSGLRSTAPDMKRTMDAYLDQQSFMDVQVLATLGMTEEDLGQLLAQPGIAAGEGAYVIDAFANGGSTDLVTKVYSLPEIVNRPLLVAGRMPETAEECVVDAHLLARMELTLGESLTLRTQGSFSDALAQSRFTIVGEVYSPYYISVERGTSSLGSGRVAAFVYLPPAAFSMDYYSAAYLLAAGAGELTAFSEEYDELTDGFVDTLEPFAKARATLRRTELVDEANVKLAEADEKLAEAKREAEEKLADGAAELADARRELDEGWQELNDAQGTLRTEVADATLKITDAEAELSDAQIQLDEGEGEYAQGLLDLEEGRQEFEAGKETYAQGLVEYQEGAQALEEAASQLSSAENKMDAGRAELEDGQAQLNGLLEQLLPQVNLALTPAGISFATGNELLAALGAEAAAPGVVTATTNGVLGGMYAALATQLSDMDSTIAGLEGALQQNQQEIDNWTPPPPAPPDGGETPPPPDGGETPPPSGGEETPAAPDGGDETPENPTPSPAAEDDHTLSASLLHAAGKTMEELLAEKAMLTQSLIAAKAGRQQLVAGLAALTITAADGSSAPAQSEFLMVSDGQLRTGWSQYYAGAAQLSAGRAEYRAGLKELQEAKKTLAEAELELVKGEAELHDARLQISDARRELDEGWVEFEDGTKKLLEARAELTEQVDEANREIADAKHDLRSGEVEYNDGLTEYNDGQKEAVIKIADAEQEIADARRKVADIDESKWYLLTRDSNPGYLGYGQDADRMANLANVFPLLFFLVAALVCLTTMTRMVEEQRVQIGALKAMGYSRWAISRKYLGYGLLPALLGGTLGLAIGYTLFPKMIFTAYQMLYTVPNLQLSAYADITAISLLAAVACTTVATLVACLATLRASPAALMRPRAPKPGKRVLLEYIRPLWRRMGFNHKVTARNLLRYQKRFWMTVFGIGGCTALIIAGFGIRSSLTSALERQYSEITRYTAQIMVSDNLLDTERQDVVGYLAGRGDILSTTAAYMASATAESRSYSTTAYLMVAQSEELAEMISLREYGNGQGLTLDERGVIINQKLSELLDLGAGDTLTLDADGRYELPIVGVTENYLGHYVYMTPRFYQEYFGDTEEANSYLLLLEEDTEEACSGIFADLLAKNGVVSVSRISDDKNTYLSSMESIDFVVVIVILSAAALAMVVLFNLSNINITERKRELATIKVLGFYDGEVSAYVYRENIVLTAVGILFGSVLGHYLHVWLVRSVEIDLMMFGRETDPWAYLWAGVLTAGFSVGVNLLAHRRMRQIDMVESLKSAE